MKLSPEDVCYIHEKNSQYQLWQKSRFINRRFALNLLSSLLSKEAKVTELGPGTDPLIERLQVSQRCYFEKYSSEKLKRRNKDYSLSDCETLYSYFNEEIDGPFELIPGLLNSDAVVSSHVFEHVASPLHHLESVAKITRIGGIVYFIIPDATKGIDYTRPLSNFSELLRRWQLDLKQADEIDQLEVELYGWSCHNRSSYANIFTDDKIASKILDQNYASSTFMQSLIHGGNRCSIEPIQQANPSPIEFDMHVCKYSPSTFRHIMFSQFIVGISDLFPLYITDTIHTEFHAILVKRERSEEAVKLALNSLNHLIHT